MSLASLLGPTSGSTTRTSIWRRARSTSSRVRFVFASSFFRGTMLIPFLCAARLAQGACERLVEPGAPSSRGEAGFGGEFAFSSFGFLAAVLIPHLLLFPGRRGRGNGRESEGYLNVGRAEYTLLEQEGTRRSAGAKGEPRELPHSANALTFALDVRSQSLERRSNLSSNDLSHSALASLAHHPAGTIFRLSPLRPRDLLTLLPPLRLLLIVRLLHLLALPSSTNILEDGPRPSRLGRLDEDLVGSPRRRLVVLRVPSGVRCESREEGEEDGGIALGFVGVREEGGRRGGRDARIRRRPSQRQSCSTRAFAPLIRGIRRPSSFR